uniref:EPS8 signaling adaptor L3a n=1 Tax=Neolamprologus brichardi TaxID=32507 RepID=A0A3Q4GTD5_NEOBR
MDEAPSRLSNMSRPSAKSIYLQRQEYAASINKMMGNFQCRVEHLFTCDLDGKDLKNITDCVDRLNLLEEMGHVWGQNMQLEVQGTKMMLTDIENKDELESMPLSDIQEFNAVLNAGVFNSLLTVSVQARKKHNHTVFMFQCDDVRWLFSFLQDMLNHILSDIEIFMGQLAAAEAKNAKKKKKMKKKQKGKGHFTMPSQEEFEECLHKIKFGLNLLGELNGKINNPSAPEFVHSFFVSLKFVVSHCPEVLPPSIIAPLLTPQCIRLMSEVASTEEDELWQSLGDAWNIPSTQWPEDDEDIPTYTPQFFDGWQPPEVTAEPPPTPPLTRQRSAPKSESMIQCKVSVFDFDFFPSSMEPKPREVRVKSDFISRNQRELTVRKGEIVQLLDKSKQWWKVRNDRGEEGFVPSNILSDNDHQPDEEEIVASPVLTKRSKPAEVKAWLEDKGFSKITVRCLGVVSGTTLLGMTREELKVMCPEEGGRVFFQLKAVRSQLAVSDKALLHSLLPSMWSFYRSMLHVAQTTLLCLL